MKKALAFSTVLAFLLLILPLTVLGQPSNTESTSIIVKIEEVKPAKPLNY